VRSSSSTTADGSAALARRAGALVIDEPRRGYGQAYLTGFAAASGDFSMMIDADLSYDFDEIPRFVEALAEGAELVIGNRMSSTTPVRCRSSAGSATRS